MGAGAARLRRRQCRGRECGGGRISGAGGGHRPRLDRPLGHYRANNKERHVTTTTTQTTTYSIDKAHSEATFQVRHLLTKVRGRFSEFEGTIEYHEANPERSSV